MSVLALKAIDYGAEQIPDKFFEKIPGGYFTPAEKKQRKDREDRKNRDKERHRSEERSSRKSSRRDANPQTDYTDDSAYDDSDYERERERRKRDRRRRARSEGRNTSRSPSRARHDPSRQNPNDNDGYRDMARAEQGDPYFPPPPTSEYAPYNPQDYAAQPAQGDYRPSSAGQPYGYPPQVNTSFPSRSATFPSTAFNSTPVIASASRAMPSPMWTSRPASNFPTSSSIQPPLFKLVSCASPVSASFSPSYEPPLATLLQRSYTNPPKPASGQGYSPTYSPNPVAGQQHRSSTASRYTPGPGYAPSPLPHHAGPIPTSYNPAEFPPGSAGYQAANNAYASPPPFSRQRSNSNPPYPAYNPDQRVSAYDDTRTSSRRDSTKPRREHRHRARSADTTHSSRKDDHHRDNSRMTKVRDRFDSMDLRGEGLVAAVGGALAGGLAGRQLGRSKLTTLAGAAAGAFGGKTIADKRSKSKGPSRDRSRSRSRTRRHADDRTRSSRSPTPPRGIRARSKSIIDRIRSKSRGGAAPDDRDHRTDSHRDGRDSRYDSSSRPDHGYESRDRGRGRDEEYEYFSSDSEGDGSPVAERRRRRSSRNRDY